MEQNKLAIIIEKSTLDNKELYKDFFISSIRIRKEHSQLDVYIGRDFVPSFKLANELEKAIESYFSTLIPGFRVVCYFSYQEKSTTEETVKEYCYEVIDLISSRSGRIVALKSLNNNITSSEVCFYCANFEEQNVFDPLAKVLYNEFRRYGLSFINCHVSVSSFETSVSEVIEKTFKLSEDKLKTQIELENKRENPVSNQTIESMKNRKGVKRPRMSNPINGDVTKLKDIPNTEYEIIEYSQIHENCRFVVEGTIVKSEIREIKNFKLYVATLFDGEDSIIIKCFISQYAQGSEDFYKKDMATGMNVRVYGDVIYDKFERDVCLQIKDSIGYGPKVENLLLMMLHLNV